MDIRDPKALAAPPVFALNLKNLPRELVHQVLNDLPLGKVFEVLSHKNSYLDECVLTHNAWNRVFRSSKDIAEVVDDFILYREMRRFFRVKQITWNTLLQRTHYHFSPARNHILVLREYFWQCFKSYLPRPGKAEMAMLENQMTMPMPLYTGATIVAYWAWVKEAKLKVNDLKARQLELMANLMANYPKKLTVKKPTDPSQNGPRLNSKHIEDNFRVRARKAQNNGKLRWENETPCRKAADNIELVPYDRYLGLFLEVLKEHPVTEIDSDIAGNLPTELSQFSLDKVATSAKSFTAFHYPPTIATEIKKVLEGLMYIYTGSPLLVVPRINWDGPKPTFHVESATHPLNLPAELHRCVVAKAMPHDRREYEWLSAFLKVVTWMEKEFWDETPWETRLYEKSGE